MNDIDAWIQNQADRQKRIVFLEDALLSNRFAAYAWYRLRFFVLRLGTESTIHLVRFLLLSHFFSTREFVAILLLYAGAGLANSFWWGSLESMRGRVRDLRRSGRPHLIPQEIGRWLSLAVQLSLALMGAAAVVWIGWYVLDPGAAAGAVGVYSIAVVARLSLDLIARCYHSGIYSIRRVYRPAAAIVGVELVAFAGLVLTWPLIGAWSFSVGAGLSAAIVTGVVFHYTRRAYSFFGFAPSRHLSFGRVGFPSRHSLKETLVSGASYSVMHLDSLLILALFGMGPVDVDETAVLVLFFVISPVVRAGFDWAQLFYFDLKRLDIRLFRNLRERFERLVLRLAWFMAFLFWALASVLGTLAYGSSLGLFYLLMLPFFVSRSLLAATQIKEFSRRGYLRLLGTGALFIPGFLVMGFLLDGQGVKLGFLSALTLVVLVLLSVQGRSGHDDDDVSESLWPTVWIDRVSTLARPVRVGVLRMSGPPADISRDRLSEWQEDNRWRNTTLADRIARRLGRYGGVTAIRFGHILWYERASERARISEDWLVSHTGGLVTEIRDTGVQASGPAALMTARGNGLLGNEIKAGWTNDGAPDERSVERAFRSIFPRGLVYDPMRPMPHEFNRLTSEEKRSILSDAVACVRDSGPARKRASLDVTAFCVGGELRLIFLVERRISRKLRHKWRTMVRGLSLAASLRLAPRAARASGGLATLPTEAP
jgi:hypothetical protein